MTNEITVEGQLGIVDEKVSDEETKVNQKPSIQILYTTERQSTLPDTGESQSNEIAIGFFCIVIIFAICIYRIKYSDFKDIRDMDGE